MTLRHANRPRARWVRALNIPIYVLALLLGITFPYWQPFSFFAVSLFVGLVYSYAYTQALHYFMRHSPPLRARHFILVVLVAQGLVLSVTLYLMSA